MPAFVVVDIEITDPVQYEEYKKLAAPTVTAHGGKYVVRGGEAVHLEGERPPGRVVVLEFPNLERARAWWNSESYAPAKAIRQASARTEMVLVDGV